MKVHKIYFLLAFVAPTIQAKDLVDNLKVKVSAGTQLSDNGRKNIRNDQEETERQDNYKLDLGYGYTNDWSNVSVNYSFNQWLYSIKSQPDHTSLVGDARLDLGGNFQPVHLALTHTRQSLLKTPDAVDLSNNRDERSIVKAEPSLQLKLSDADLFTVSASASDIAYDEQSGVDSKLAGGQLAWMREISKIQHFQIAASTSKASFDTQSSFNYRFEVLAATYSVNLRHFNYRISAGENRAKLFDNGEEFKRPTYDVLMGYSNPSFSLDFTFNQKISNSSTGDGHSDGFVGAGIDAVNTGLDLINFKTAGVLLSTPILCARCKLTLAAEDNKEEYQTLSENSLTKKMKASLIYGVGRQGSLQLSFTEYKRTFAFVGDLRNFKRKASELSYLHSFAKGMNLKVFVRKHENDSATSLNTYNENLTGISLGYDF